MGIEKKLDSDSLQHFGIKGMRWGQRKKSTGATAPRRPREAGSNASREEKLVSRAVNQGYDRVVGPKMAMHIANIPKHSISNDPKVNEFMARMMTQSVNRVEAEAGKRYMQRLPR